MARVLASLIDVALAFLLAALLASTSGWFFAERAVVTFRIDSPDTVWNGPLPLVLGAVSTVSYGFAFALLLVLAGEALWGASPGKVVTRRVIVGREQEQTRAARWRRFAGKTAPWWLFCLALLAGRWELAVVAVACGVVLLVEAGVAALRGGANWYDRMARTRVDRSRQAGSDQAPPADRSSCLHRR